MGYVTPLVAKEMNAPNPFNPLSNDSQKNITRVYLPGELKGSYLKMYVFNIAGEKIRTVESGLASRADWDGCNDNNNVVANGIYFYVVETNKGRAKGKITVIKE
ncbi:MAG: gliding motility-associated C-terminal domain-containing protein [Elusimicrobiota bacterium]